MSHFVDGKDEKSQCATDKEGFNAKRRVADDRFCDEPSGRERTTCRHEDEGSRRGQAEMRVIGAENGNEQGGGRDGSEHFPYFNDGTHGPGDEGGRECGDDEPDARVPQCEGGVVLVRR